MLHYVSYIMYLRYFFHYVFMCVFFSRHVKKHILKNFAYVWLSKNGVWKPNEVRFTVIDFCITCCRQNFCRGECPLLFQWKRKWSQFTKTQRHFKLAFKLLYLFVYNNYKEFEISVLSLSHWKLKGLGQWSLIGVNAIGTGKSLQTASHIYKLKIHVSDHTGWRPQSWWILNIIWRSSQGYSRKFQFYFFFYDLFRPTCFLTYKNVHMLNAF